MLSYVKTEYRAMNLSFVCDFLSNACHVLSVKMIVYGVYDDI